MLVGRDTPNIKGGLPINLTPLANVEIWDTRYHGDAPEGYQGMTGRWSMMSVRWVGAEHGLMPVHALIYQSSPEYVDALPWKMTLADSPAGAPPDLVFFRREDAPQMVRLVDGA